MSDDTVVVWDESLLAYDLGDHPLDPVRVELTIALARELGVLERAGVRLVPPTPADDALLTRVHDPRYLDAVRIAPRDPLFAGFGLGTSDNPVFDGMHESSALVAGASVIAAEAVWRGTARRAVNVAGGLHHAMPARAAGFCVYNDPAVAIARLLDLGAERIAYVDVDVHHGDGVQQIFWDDPRVLTVSLHETPLALFPGTGFPDETGGPNAAGTAVNIPLPPGIEDAGWQRAFHAVVPSVLRAFRPQLLFTQCGADAHRVDPLADLHLSVDGSAPPTWRCGRSPTSCATGVGWPPAAVGTPWSRWCLGPGRICWRCHRRAVGSGDVDSAGLAGTGRHPPAGLRRAAADDRRRRPGVRAVAAHRGTERGRPGDRGDPQSGLPAARPRPARSA